MHRRRLAVPATTLALALATTLTFAPAAGSAPKPRIAATTLLIKGSTTMQSTVDAVATKFERATQGRVRIIVSGGTSDFGLSQLAKGGASLANVSRDPIAADGRLNVKGGKSLIFNKVARDAICIATSRENPLNSLSRAQVQGIFSGQIASWSQVPGSQVNGPINLYVRPNQSGTNDSFQTIFMGLNRSVDDRATEVPQAGAQASQIGNDSNGIGYVSFKFTDGLHNVPYNGVRCTQRAARSKQYKGVRNLWMVTRGAPTGPSKAFIRFFRNNSAAKRIVNKVFLPR